MRTPAVLAAKAQVLDMQLRRGFWQPLRRMMEIFHVLPLTAALIISFLLAFDAQVREIYVATLEDLKPDTRGGTLTAFASTAGALAAAALGVAMISAILFAAHYRLSTMRMNIICSSNSNPDARSMLRKVQRMAAIGLSLVPWLGVVAGLLGARSHLADRYHQLREVAHVQPVTLDAMQHVPVPGALMIAVSGILAALAFAIFLDVYRQDRVLKVAGVGLWPIAAACWFLLLTDSFPFSGDEAYAIAAGTIIAAFALVHYVVYYRLDAMRARFVYAHRFHRDTGINLRRRRRMLLVAWTLLPSIAIALYVAIAPAPVTEAVSTSAASWHGPRIGRWALFPVAMSWAITAGMVVTVLLDRLRESVALQPTIALGVGALVLAAILTAFLDVDEIVSLYRAVGPLGSMALQLLFLIAMLLLLALLSQRSGFPALALVVLAIVVTVMFPIPVELTVAALTALCVFLFVIALLSRLPAVAVVAAILAVPGVLTLHEMRKVGEAEPNPKPVADLHQQFECWLDEKGLAAADPRSDSCPDAAARPIPTLGDPRSPVRPYPLFIIAVEGGGIYAASAASLFLARLQDHMPEFSEHVFAISGVSGGAIGATIFQALAQSEFKKSAAPVLPPASSANSAKTPGTPSLRTGDGHAARSCMGSANAINGRPMTDALCGIMLGDHFSPIVGAIFPELLGAATGRAETLAGSFEKSVRSHDAAAAKALGDSFAAHWSQESRAPALVLNATWVETGFRTAFAPFPLHDIDESLYSFYDQGMPNEHNRSLTYAAIVSARFPGFLPPFSVAINDARGLKRWNFVDGGYTDSSGTTTALALYKALDETATQHSAEIRVILLTSSNPQPDLSKISGTVFRDTLAPVDAVLKVREGLGNEAVARACDQFYLSERSNDKATDRSAMCRNHARDPAAKLWIVEIEDQTYGLPLGWKLSRTSLEMVSWMLGDFDTCTADAPEAKAAHEADLVAEGAESGTRQLNEETLIRNSCVLSSVAALLRGKPSGLPAFENR